MRNFSALNAEIQFHFGEVILEDSLRGDERAEVMI